jgi:hypothetical protein
MFQHILKYLRPINHNEKYKNTILDIYDIQYIYCQNCIKCNNIPNKMYYSILNPLKNKEIDCLLCHECKSFISLSYIKETDFVFDNTELKKFILKDDSYYKIICLLIFWKQPKNIVSDSVLIERIILDLKQDNFHTLLQYDPNYSHV